MSTIDDGAARSRRVFFALWPDEATRSAVSRTTRNAVRLSGGQPIAKDRLHVTVAFLGEIGPEAFERARGAAPIKVGEFDIVLDTLGIWPQSRVLWLAAGEVPEPLVDLEEQLWVALEDRGFRPEERIYRPHLTLARRAREVEEVIEPVTWRVRELALVESFPDGRNVHYEVVETWPL